MMEYKVLYRKYRPDCFKNLVGQEYTVKMLQNAIIHQKISHAYLFTGPRGTGKTSTAKIFAKTINCEHLENGEACGKCNSCLSFDSSPDIIEIDAASNNGVDDIRELINNVKIAPTEGKYKIYIIDEVHMMTQSAFNALLLTLEEPPKHAVFILATTNVESVPITILSRCQRFNFKKFSVDELKSQIHYVCEKENISITDEATTEIAYLSEGGMRDALSLLDQLSSNGEEITVDKILTNYGSISMQFIQNLISNIEKKEVDKISNAILELQKTSSDYKIFIKKMVQELCKIAVQIKSNTYSGNLSYSQIKSMIFEFNDCLNKININVNPFIIIEMILLNSLDESESRFSVKQDASKQIEDILSRKEKVEVKPVSPVVNEERFSDEPQKIESFDFHKFKQIRVNNCFVGAKKEDLIRFKALWTQSKNIEVFSPELLSLVMDSDVVAASSDYLILTSKLDSNVNNINRNVGDIENSFHQNTKIVCLSNEEWTQEKKIYVANLKKGVQYQMIEEDVMVVKNNNNEEEDSLATNVFNRDKIEIV